MLHIRPLVKLVLSTALLSLVLPGMGRAASCEVGQAIFEPKDAGGAFTLRAFEDQGHLLWQLVVRKTGETFAFRTETDSAGQTWLVSLPRDGEDPDMRMSVRMLDGKGVETQDRSEVSRVSIFDLWRVFSEYRKRKGQPFEPGTNPPAGMWDVTECRPK